MPDKPLSSVEKNLLDEFLKQIGTQAALFAGFTFGILTTVDYQSNPQFSYWFALSGVVTVALELLAAVLSDSLVYLTKLEQTEKIPDAFKWQTVPAVISYLLGIFTFIVTLDLLLWIKFLPVALAGTIILSIAVIVGTVLLVLAVAAHDRIANP